MTDRIKYANIINSKKTNFGISNILIWNNPLKNYLFKH